ATKERFYNENGAAARATSPVIELLRAEREAGSVPSAAPLIEDYTAAALWTDEPFTSSCISESERPSANRPRRHGRTVPRAGGRFARRARLPTTGFLR